MSEVTVITNNVPRDLVEPWETTGKEREELSYLDWPALAEGEASVSLVRYKGEIYDLNEFNRPSPPMTEWSKDWDGIQPDSFFSGILVRYCEDHESVVMGRFYC